jgi:hypothetical protein
MFGRPAANPLSQKPIAIPRTAARIRMSGCTLSSGDGSGFRIQGSGVLTRE